MIAYRIILLRKNAGMSQTQLARKLNISPSAQGNYEQGRRLPSIDMLIRLSELFGVSLDYLITGTDHHALGKPERNPREGHCPCATCHWAKQ